MASDTITLTRVSRTTRVGEAFLLVAAALLFFTNLSCPLLEPEETRYAEIPRQMLAAGSFVVPVVHGQPYYDKPPLLYWLVMASYAVFGVHDWAARLVSSGAALLCVPLTYWWGRRTVGVRAALAGSLMLCLSARSIHLGRLLTMNSLLCLCVVAALATAHVALRKQRLSWRWWLLSATACGLGLLTKGPVALLLVVVPLFSFRFLDPQVTRPRWGCVGAYLIVAGGVAAPWFLAVAAVDPTFLRYFFWTHHVVRFVAPLDHSEPAWYYLPGLLLGMLPWTLLLPELAKHLTAVTRDRGRPGPAGCFVAAALWCLVFYSAAGCKRSGYILPAMPPLALALGWCFDRRFLSPKQPRLAPWAACFAGTFLLLVGSVTAFLPAYAERFSLRRIVGPCSETQGVPVYCYPHRWDSVNFYLQRDDIQVFTREQRAQLFADLIQQSRTLLFIKSEPYLAEFVRALPDGLEFVPCGRQFSVTVGWVRPRPSGR